MPSFCETMLTRYVCPASPASSSCSIGSLALSRPTVSFAWPRLHRTQADEIRIATQHPFLAAAGRHELSSAKLSEWLTQDRMYALHGCRSLFLLGPGRHCNGLDGG